MVIQIFVMKKLFLCFILSATAIALHAQYKNDNVSYKTAFPQDLCKELLTSKGYLLLDVRSPGEYADTSSSPLYNYGHLQAAVNIDVSEIGKRYNEIIEFKNKPVFVYCSHSQRSRRASKMLADSGFTNVINVNGGITAIRKLPSENCISKMLVTHVGYDIISPEVLCTKLSGNNNIFLLDVRSDSAFRHIALNADANGLGFFRNSYHIPLTDLKKRIDEVPMDKEIIITDLYGDEAAKAAVILHDHKFPNVSMLIEGINRLFYTENKKLPCLKEKYLSPVQYSMISSIDLGKFLEKNKDYLALDVRSADEFNNQHKDYWRNIGKLVNAVNIPSTELKDKITTIGNYKDKPVIVYAFGSGKEAHEAAAILISSGFSNVRVLAGGLFNIRWTANNVPGNKSLEKLVTDIPADNL